MTRPLEVAAWGRATYPLTPGEAADLQHTGLVSVEVTGTPGAYTLGGKTLVGVAAGPGWELRVSSHLEVRDLMFLLCYARNPLGWKTALAGFSKGDDLLSSTAWGFAQTAENALRAGPLRGYRHLEERTVAPRGRIQIGAQLARGGLAIPVDVERDEFDADILENRLLLAAAVALGRLSLVHRDVRQRLRRLESLLKDVAYEPERSRLSLPSITRVNKHYEPALVLADVVLSGTSVRADAGDRRSVTFSFELHRVFEDFLDVALGDAISRRGGRLVKKPPSRWLDEQSSIELKPDFSVRRSAQTVAIVDAKFKRIESRPGDDAYQMLAYLKAFEPSRGMLVSATGSTSDHSVVATGESIVVRRCRVDLAPESILRQVDAIAVELLAENNA